MTPHIAGSGCITPLGRGPADLFNRLLAGEHPPVQSSESPLTRQTRHTIPVHNACGPFDDLVKHPRLRRASPASLFAAAASLDALRSAGIDPANPPPITLIYAVVSGGVSYTRRFYEKIVSENASAASPILFPETVYNAPASHLAALLNLDTPSYTIVGDASAGIEAIRLARDLLAARQASLCLVTATEELDFSVCDAYADSRLYRASPPPAAFEPHPRGLTLSEGAASLLLSPHSGRFAIETIAPSHPICTANDHGPAIAAAIASLCLPDSPPDLAIAGANGTRLDQLEAAALQRHAPQTPCFAPKSILGEAFAASSILQVILATEALLSGALPATRGSTFPQAATTPRTGLPGRRALVSTPGLNQQANALTLVPGTATP